MAKEHPLADCYCETCKRNLHHLDVDTHRAVHHRKHQDCVIVYSDGRKRRIIDKIHFARTRDAGFGADGRAAMGTAKSGGAARRAWRIVSSFRSSSVQYPKVLYSITSAEIGVVSTHITLIPAPSPRTQDGEKRSYSPRRRLWTSIHGIPGSLFDDIGNTPRR